MTHRLPVIAPECCTVHGRRPLWERAWKGQPWGFDPDDPFIQLPYGGGDYGDDYCVTRVYFDRRLYRAELYRKRIKAVELERDGEGRWVWVVEVNG